MNTRSKTYIRHTNERGYGRLKDWKIIDGVVPWQYLDKIDKIISVLMATENRFFVALITHSEERQQRAEIITAHMQHPACLVAKYLPKTYVIRGITKSGWYDCVGMFVIKQMIFQILIMLIYLNYLLVAVI